MNPKKSQTALLLSATEEVVSKPSGRRSSDRTLRHVWDVHRVLILVPGTLTSVLIVAMSTCATPPTKITSTVAPAEDVAAEIRSLLASVETSLESEVTYLDRRDQVRRQAIQLAILSQTLADHENSTDISKSASDLRVASTMLSRANSWVETGKGLARAKEALTTPASGAASSGSDWSDLASARALMPIMKERTEAIRKALRRPKDPAAESRHAMAVALMILAVHQDTRAVKDPADQPAWKQICLDLQNHLSMTATSIRSKDTSSAADHFRLGMEACDQCHQKFKP